MTSGLLAALLDRLEAGVGRMVSRIPPALAGMLSGGVRIVDGQTLAPDVALVLRTRKLLGEDALRASTVVRARARLTRATRVHRGATVDVASVEPLMLGGRPARRYVPRVPGGPLVLYFHGGGMVVGDLETHDVVARRLCRDVGVPVVSVEYRLAPEHKFPAAVDDALAAYDELRMQGASLGGDGRVIVAGDSAGGCLAAVIAQARRGTAGPLLQLLVYPAVDRTRRYPSQALFASGYLLSSADVDWYDAQYSDRLHHEDPRISPGAADALDDVAPALVYTAGFDPLRDEAEAYARRLAEVGRLVELRRFPGLVHGFLQLGAVSRSSEAAFEAITSAMRRAISRA